MTISNSNPLKSFSGTQQLDKTVAQQVLKSLRKSEVSTADQCDALTSFLEQHPTGCAEARELLQGFVDSHGKQPSGQSVCSVRSHRSKGDSGSRGLPDGQVSGQEIDSKYADGCRVYRKESMPIDVLRQTGAPAEIIALLDRADNLDVGDGNGCVSVAELVQLEDTCALLPDEQAALKQVWRFIEAKGKHNRATPVDVPPLEITDLSTRPSELPITQVPVKIAGLPENLQRAATRAAMIAGDCKGAPKTVSLAALSFAIESRHDQSTPSDRAKFEQLCEPVQTAAIEQTRCDYEAKVRVPDIGVTTQKLVSCGALGINLKTQTLIRGSDYTRGHWSARGTSHRRGSVCIPAPKNFPPPSKVTLTASQNHQLQVTMPKGYRLVLSQPGDKKHHVITGTDVPPLKPGRYDAFFMHNGRVIREAAINLPADKNADLSKYFGFDMVSKSGQSIALTTSERSKGNQYAITAAVGAGGHAIRGSEHPIKLEPGRYQGELEGARGGPFGLEVLPGNNLTVFAGDASARLVFSSSSHSYVGNIGKRVFRFNPKTNLLSTVTERIQESHGSTSWTFGIKGRRGPEMSITDKMRVG